jgi:hypothetical protein
MVLVSGRATTHNMERAHRAGAASRHRRAWGEATRGSSARIGRCNAYNRPRPCENPANFCKQSRRAKFFAIFSLPSGLRARKSEQNRSVSKRVGVFTQARPEARVPELDSPRAKSARKLPSALRPGCVELPGLISATRQIIRLSASRGRGCGIQGFVVRSGEDELGLVTNDGHRLMCRRSRTR